MRRLRSTTNRRCVPTTLTNQGRNLVDTLDRPVSSLQQEQF
ncbi:hypothetical protein [Deinococcus sp. UYEF24]